jgi:type I restriction enzyme M protein
LLQKISEKESAFTKSISSDWLFNAAIIECLKEDVKVVTVITYGSTWNTLDKTVRKHFIENGYIEAVISLLEKMFEGISIPVTMMIMSRNNKRIMLVDTTKMCRKGRM